MRRACDSQASDIATTHRRGRITKIVAFLGLLTVVTVRRRKVCAQPTRASSSPGPAHAIRAEGVALPSLIPFDEIIHLFAEFEHTAFRLETRRGYATDRQGQRFQAFTQGILPRPESHHRWNVNVCERSAQGARFSRVRIVDEPPTDGQRFLMAIAAGNVAAGEDIRVLSRADAQRLELPEVDRPVPAAQ